MCGICGIFNYRSREPVSRSVLMQMVASLHHRGPDARGYWIRQHFGFAMRRLSVIDLATGDQPIANEDGSIRLIFNGEIYNYQDLRAQLSQQGHLFRTRTDTEVVVHLYEEYGLDCFLRLNGMFALALWDERYQRLVLARDRLGIKPLFYLDDNGALVFGSEIKALLPVDAFVREIDPAALRDYLTYLYVPAPATIFKRVRKLLPGHLAIIDANGMIEKRYWQFQLQTEDGRHESDYLDQLDQCLHDSVRRQMISDVPIGSLLSGGIDSGLLAHKMSQLSTAPVRTFTVGFQIPALDERVRARKIVTRIGSQHTELNLAENVLDILPALVWHFDEPFGDEAAIPIFLLAQAMRSQVKVALAGDGADELFAGYHLYRRELFTRRYLLLPRSVRSLVQTGIAHGIQFRMPPELRDWLGWLQKGLILAETNPVRRYLEKLTIFNPELKASLLGPDPASPDHAELLALFSQAHRTEFVEQLYFSIINFNLSNRMLVKIDRASMAHSVEIRVPYLDNEMVDLAARLPFRFKVRGLVTKYALRKIYARYDPGPIRRSHKQGLELPLKYWLRAASELSARRILNPERLKQHGLFDAQVVTRLLDEHAHGVRDHARRIYGLLIFQIWFEVFMNQKQPRDDVAQLEAGAIAANAGQSF